MRRLPVYLLIDTSGSMHGEAIEAVRNGLQVLVSALRQDPYALETAYLSVITFDSSARQITPLTELVNFQTPDIQAGGTTAMGAALSLLADCIRREVVQGSAEQKGDWKPVVFLLSDGAPTDSIAKGIADMKTVKTGAFVACAAGASADTNTLKQITETAPARTECRAVSAAHQRLPRLGGSLKPHRHHPPHKNERTHRWPSPCKKDKA